MPLTPFMCANCGSWQKYFATPPDCPVCSDVRNALPEDGWEFKTPAEVDLLVSTTWHQPTPGIVMFQNRPTVGIGPCGYLILHPEGNIAFEAAGWYSADALAHIQSLGGIRFLSASHPHGFGALWQLQDRFHPPHMVMQREAVRFTKAFRVNYPFDDECELMSGATLHYVGGHYEGQSVLYHEPTGSLFAGDSLKFELDAQGHATGVSCHKAFHNQIPLSHAEVRKYREVLGRLPFRQVFTPFEHVPHATREDAMRLFDAHLAGIPFVTPMALA